MRENIKLKYGILYLVLKKWLNIECPKIITERLSCPLDVVKKKKH